MPTQNTLPLLVQIAKLPDGFSGTWQEFADALAERIIIQAQQTFALFTAGSAEPATDVGPWAKNGNEWFYFDPETGKYEPFLISMSRLGYQISVEEPTDDSINLWFQIDEDGTPLAIRFRQNVGGSIEWPSPYYLKSETFSQAEAAAALLFQVRYAAKAQANATQSLDVDGSVQKLNLQSETYDIDGAYSPADSRYIAPVKGIYTVHVVTQFDNDGGSAANMQVGVAVIKNGVGFGPNVLGATTAVASPPGSRWFVNFSGDVLLNAGDFIELAAIPVDGVGSGNLDFGAGVGNQWSIHLSQGVV